MEKMPNLFEIFPPEKTIKNVVPMLKEVPYEAEYKYFLCSSCKQDKVMNWTYKIRGSDDWVDVQINDRCLDCLNHRQSKVITQEMDDKRKETLLKSWWFIDDEKEYAGFKTFEQKSNVQIEAFKKAYGYTHDFSNRNMKDLRNLLVMGSVGTGKSHLTKAIARTLKQRGFKVAYIESEMLFQKIKATFGNEKEYQRFYKQYEAFDLVVIDDVGVETKNIKEISWGVSEWTKLVNAREGKCTVYTTNFDDVSLAQVIGERAFDRMYQGTRFIEMFTDSYRPKQKVD